MKSIKDIFGENLKRIRKARGWTQEMLAENSGLSMGTVQHLELGDRWIGVETLEALSATLEVNQTDFFSPSERQVTPLEALQIIEKALKSQVIPADQNANLPEDIQEMLGRVPKNAWPIVRAALSGIVKDRSKDSKEVS